MITPQIDETAAGILDLIGSLPSFMLFVVVMVATGMAPLMAGIYFQWKREGRFQTVETERREARAVERAEESERARASSEMIAAGMKESAVAQKDAYNHFSDRLDANFGQMVKAVSNLQLQCSDHTAGLRQGQGEMRSQLGGIEKELGRVVDAKLSG